MVVVCLVLLVAVIVALFVGSRTGHWLVVSEPLAKAQAIFPHAGRPPFRELEAAQLYRDGWAPEVWIAPVEPGEEQQLLQRIGVEIPAGWSWRRDLLEKLGVPADSIRVLPALVRNTEDEVRAVVEQLEAGGGQRVILVSSKVHTRRIRSLWGRTAPSTLEAVVQPAREDPLDPARWWTNTDDGEQVIHELVAMVDLWLGGWLRPERPGDRSDELSSPEASAP